MTINFSRRILLHLVKFGLVGWLVGWFWFGLFHTALSSAMIIYWQVRMFVSDE
jgi:hypothetical protein